MIEAMHMNGRVTSIMIQISGDTVPVVERGGYRIMETGKIVVIEVITAMMQISHLPIIASTLGLILC